MAKYPSVEISPEFMYYNLTTEQLVEFIGEIDTYASDWDFTFALIEKLADLPHPDYAEDFTTAEGTVEKLYATVGDFLRAIKKAKP